MVFYPLLAAGHYRVCILLKRNGVKLCQVISDLAAQLKVQNKNPAWPKLKFSWGRERQDTQRVLLLTFLSWDMRLLLFIGQKKSPGQPGREIELRGFLWLLLQTIEGADKRRDTKGMERQTQSSCGGFDEVEVKVYSLICFACLPLKWFPGWAQEC